MKVRDVIRRLESEGWYQARQKGSHRQFRHPDRPGLVTVAGKRSADLPGGTLRSIERQAGWRNEDEEAAEAQDAAEARGEPEDDA